MQRKEKVEGIVIKRRDFGEADRVLTLFTKYHGKVQVNAKGVRKVPSRRGPHVELLNHGTFSLYKSGKIPTLTEVEAIEDFHELKQNLETVEYAYHLCELIDGLCPEEESLPQVFGLLEQTLEKLQYVDNYAQVVHQFEIDLLRILGFSHMTQDDAQRVDTEKLIEDILERRLKSRRVFEKLQR
jgi:DNA repair protein RecO (recombination protein O)